MERRQIDLGLEMCSTRARDGAARPAARAPRGRRREQRDRRTPKHARGKARSAAAGKNGSRRSDPPARTAMKSHRRRHGRAHRSRQERARAGAHRHRSRSAQGREGARHHHRARLRARRRSATCASRSSTCPGTSVSCKHDARRRRRHRLRAAGRRRRRSGDAADARALRHLPAAARPRGIVVLTKADAADADTRELVRRRGARSWSRGSFLERRPIVPVSARTGEGLDQLREACCEAAAARATSGRSAAPRGCRSIARFSMKGFGTVVTGTLVGGQHARRTTSSRCCPAASVREGARAAGARTVARHGRGRAADCDQSRRHRQRPMSVAARRWRRRAYARSHAAADVEIELLPLTRPLRHGARVRVHHGTAEVLARISIAGADAPAIESGGRALARLRLEDQAILTRGDRVILRSYSPP